MTILVTGATGQIGRRVVERLVRAGATVRAMTRRPEQATVLPDGVEVVRGDLAEPSSLEVALRGAERMYLFPVAATAKDVVGMAVAAGVRRVVTLSSGAVEGGYDTDFDLPVEQAVEAWGVAWTHLRVHAEQDVAVGAVCPCRGRGARPVPRRELVPGP